MQILVTRIVSEIQRCIAKGSQVSPLFSYECQDISH